MIALHRTGGVQRLRPVFRIVSQASTALRRSNRLRGGPGGLGVTEGHEARDIESWSSLSSLCINDAYGCLSIF